MQRPLKRLRAYPILVRYISLCGCGSCVVVLAKLLVRAKDQCNQCQCSWWLTWSVAMFSSLHRPQNARLTMPSAPLTCPFDTFLVTIPYLRESEQLCILCASSCGGALSQPLAHSITWAPARRKNLPMNVQCALWLLLCNNQSGSHQRKCKSN